MLLLRRARPGRTLAALAGLAIAAGLLGAGPAPAYAANVRVDLKVLVVDNGSPGVDLIVAQLAREGVPYDTVNLSASNRPPVTPAFLSDTVGGVARSKYQGFVLPDGAALSATEMTALAGVETKFGLRQIDAYVAATAAVGLSTTWSGSADGAALSVSAAGQADGFGYLNGALSVDDRDPTQSESWAYLGAPLAGVTFTPLVTATSPDGSATGSVVGVYAHDGREELAVTMAANRYQTQAEVLGHGLVNWLTRGVHLGYWRNYFSLHVDDVFLPDDTWDAAANCTVGDDCNPNHDPSVTPNDPTVRMTPSDVDALVAWQRSQGFQLDLVFNGGGSVEAGTGDPLLTRLLADKSQFTWISHTYSHLYLGCVQDFTVTPWKCVTNANGSIQWTSRATIQSEISRNITWARPKGIPITASELVTGEHSGLATLPQMTVDNPNLAPALRATGVRVLASDASRETGPRTVGPARTVPRHPMNIYYNVSTTAGEIDEYNWLYTSRANGGSGICENNPSSTCITPLSTGTGFTGYIVPKESQIAFDHVVTDDPDPHYAHQSNLTGDRILYPVLNGVLDRYRATFTAATPVVNPTFSDASTAQSRSAAWAPAMSTVEAYLQGSTVTVINHGSSVAVPITVPAGTRTLSGTTVGGAYGSPYGSDRSAWTTLGRNARQLLRLP